MTWLRFGRAGTALAIAAGLVVGGCTGAGTASRPDHRPALVLLTSDGEPFARRGAYREEPVSVASLPRHVVLPVLAAEDRRFYRHGGIDLEGVLRAAVANAQAGEVVQGGSTITQQLAKLTAVGDKRTFGRKLREAFVALRLEQALTKDEILARYLSEVYYGDGVYGLNAAARHYFDKEPQDLTLAEAALLAGVINKPSRLAPTRNLAGARARAKVVLGAMVDAGWLTPAEAAAAKPARLRPGRKTLGRGAWFADWVAPSMIAALQPGLGETSARTSLDGDLQAHAERVVARALAGAGARQGATQAALVAMRPDGRVVAMVGGRDYRASQFNRAVQAKRQPGSIFKLFVYLAAAREGAVPWSMVEDAPLEVDGWSPRNADGRHHGWMSLERAFATSNNVAAVKLTEAVGRRDVIRAARDLGLTGDLPARPSLALGAGEATLLELTAAYAGVAAGAYPVIPTAVAEAEGSGGRPMDAYRERGPMLDLLNAAAEGGTGRSAALPIPVFAKTGTTQNNRDAWFVGFAGDLVVGVWVGNDDGAPMKGVGGGGIPADIWRAFMQTAVRDEIAAALAARAAEEAERSRTPPLVFGPPPSRPAPGWVERLRDLIGLPTL